MIPYISIILIANIGICALIDIWTTDAILRAGGTELNPIMEWLMERIGVLPALIISKIVLAAILFVIVITSLGVFQVLLLAIVFVIYVCVVINNLRGVR